MKLIQRSLDKAYYQSLIESNVDPLIARIAAGRPVPEQFDRQVHVLEPKLQHLDHPKHIKGINKAVDRIIQAIDQGEIIAIETDHDCDGQTSHAVMLTCLIEILGVDPKRIQSFIGHRMEEGYGLSDALTDRILAAKPRPTLVITADNGSSDELRIARLKAENIDVIVTDHHAVPQEGAPQSAYVCLNPTQADCDFPDPYIAGCMVAWLLMAAVRAEMIAQGKLADSVPSMMGVLDFVAVGTVADCVSMAKSINNRAVVKYGLKLMNQFQRPCWQAIRPLLRGSEITSQDLGFLIGPMLNSDGRLSDAFGSVNFLLSNDINEALPWAKQLFEQNNERKAIQKSITASAMKIAQQQADAGRVSLVVYLEDGHAGIHGISASRVKDQFGRPTILFSPKLGTDGVITGSARSIDAVHVRDALQWVDNQAPGLLISFGGHRGAAGLAIAHKDLAQFQDLFEQAVLQQISTDQVGPVMLTDGELARGQLTLSAVDLLKQLEPYGREFDQPVFEGTFRVEQIRLIGQDQNHAQLVLAPSLCAIWFNACEPGESLSIQPGDTIKAAYSINENIYRDTRSLQLQIQVVI